MFIEQIVELEKVFGAPLHLVDQSLIRIASNYILDPDRDGFQRYTDTTYPPWLHGITSARQLPRYKVTNSIKYVSNIGLSSFEYTDRLIFIVETLSSHWAIEFGKFIFDGEDDRVHYQLRWK